jgi:hypothetical protein
MDRTSRRRLLLVAAVPALAVVAGRLADLSGLGGVMERAAESAIRPAARGSSATVCAACGSREHAMLSADCPAAPRVRTGARA